MSLAPFLPHHLVARLVSCRRPPPAPSVDRFRAALLFSDISGFTSLTEKLQESGDQGAEEIAALVNAVFRPAIRRVQQQAGSVVGFAGDSMLALFPGSRGVRRALEVARGIDRDLPRVARGAGAPGRLTMAHVIHTGVVHGVHLEHAGAPLPPKRGGPPQGEPRRLYLVCGPALAALARQEARSIPGRILLSPAAERELRREGGADAPLVPLPLPSRAPSLPAWAAAYVGRHVLESRRWFRGEYRRVVVAFFETRGASPARLQAHLRVLGGELERHDAALIAADVTPAGVRWLCMFGVPRAYEDEVERAAAAALDVLAATGGDLRGGMHAGTVAAIWMGGPTRRSLEGIGDVTNTAARTLGRAAWGEVLVTDSLRTKLRGADAISRGSHAVQGKSAPLELHAVTRRRRAVKVEQMSSPLVGREGELHRLRAALDAARRGEGRVVAISGEAGLGKSRLKWEVCRLAAAAGFTVHEGRTRALGGRPYELFADMLRASLAIGEEEGVVAIRRRLEEEGRVRELDATTVAHLADVLGSRPEGSPLALLDPQALRHANGQALAALLQRFAAERPRVVVLEDLQWADELSVDALGRIRGVARGRALLLLLVHRPSFSPGLVDDAIVLGDLPGSAASELVRGLLGTASTRLSTAVLEKAGGNPFYVEEVVRFLRDRSLLVERGNGQIDLAADLPDLPPSLEALVDARLSQLPPGARRLVQVGAVIGRRFPRRFLSWFPEVTGRLDETLRLLESRQLIFREEALPGGGEPGFVFKHALTRDAAYGGILLAERRRIHRRVARSLERRSSRARELILGELGHHWEQAGDVRRARERFLAAARRTRAAFAFDEAARYYRAYLRLEGPPGAEGATVRNELAGGVLRPLGKSAEARALFVEAAGIAETARDLDSRVEALKGQAVVDMDAGRLRSARSALEEALARIPRGELPRRRAILLNSLGALCKMEGRLDQAELLMRRALRVHRRDDDAQRAAVVLANLGVLRELARDHGQAQRLYEEAIALHRRAGDRIAEGRTLGQLAMLRAIQGHYGESEALLGQALERHRSLGNRLSESVAMGNLGFLLRRLYRLSEADARTGEALAIAREVGDRSREHVWVANIAAIASLQGRLARSRAHFIEAIPLAERMGATDHAARSRAMLADLDRLVGRPDRAARHLAAAEAALAPLLPDTTSGALVAFVAGQLALERGDLALASVRFGWARARARRALSPVEESQAAAGLASVALSRGDSRRALRLLRVAEEVLHTTDDRAGIASILAMRALAVGRRRVLQGLSLAERALHLAERTEVLPQICTTLCILGALRNAAGGDGMPCFERARALLLEIEVGPRSHVTLSVEALGRLLARRGKGSPTGREARRGLLLVPWETTWRRGPGSREVRAAAPARATARSPATGATGRERVRGTGRPAGAAS